MGSANTARVKVWTVAEITGHIKILFNADPTLARVSVRGEISNLSVSGPSGHAYFVLKDSRSQLNAVMWSSKLGICPVRPANGTRVVATGRVTVYDAAGRYQLLVEDLRADGAGDIYAQFLLLKEKLGAEGLFDPERKKRLPAFPTTVGLVTSPTGAAVRDMVRILRERFSSIGIIISPAQVQGDEAPFSLTTALQRLVALKPDVIILGRGGGSFEELNAFNHEGLARCIASCPIPIVSAVGHESDFTIADLVADERAPTPSAAAQLVVPIKAEHLQRLADFERRLAQALRRRLERDRLRLKAAVSSSVMRFPDRLLESRRLRLDDLSQRLERGLQRHLTERQGRLDRLQATLTALDPTGVLSRGYSIVRTAEDGRIVRTVADAPPGTACDIQVSDGSLSTRIERSSAWMQTSPP